MKRLLHRLTKRRAPDAHDLTAKLTIFYRGRPLFDLEYFSARIYEPETLAELARLNVLSADRRRLAAGEADPRIQAAAEFVASLIHSWDLTEDDGRPVPVAADSLIRLFGISPLIYLAVQGQLFDRVVADAAAHFAAAKRPAG